MSEEKRGGARPGAGRPRKQVLKLSVRPDFRYIPVAVSEQFWQEFCQSAEETMNSICDKVGRPVSEAEYMKHAEMLMVDAMHRYINSKKRAEKKKGQTK